MPNFLYTMSDTQIFLLLISITVVFSLFFIVANKIFKFYKIPYKDNTAIASIASLLGIIYGILTGLICLFLLTNQNHATDAALHEGIGAARVYRDSKWVKDPLKTSLQTDLKNYISNVIRDEWPAMSQGKIIDIQNGLIILKMSDQIAKYPIQTQNDMVAIYNLTQDLTALYEGRQERIVMGGAQLSAEIWQVIFLSTFLIIIINYAFRVNFKLHLFSLAAFAIMAASILFLLITLDRPFQGEFIVMPTALEHVLKTIENDSST